MNLMDIESEKHIAFSKGKLIACFVIFVLCVLLFVWVGFLIPIQGVSAELARVTAWIAIPFFSVCAFLAVRKILDNTPALRLTNEGITDYSSELSVGFIPWSDITHVGEYRDDMQSFICIFVKNPEIYVNRGHFLQKSLRLSNMKVTGTPVAILSNPLRGSHANLLRLVNEWHQKHL